MTINKIGFIGIGVMGSSMARHLQQAGYETRGGMFSMCGVFILEPSPRLRLY